MENASKALLIAAAVLIVILLIAFGMRIFNSTGSTAKDAEGVGDTISQQVKNAATSIEFPDIDGEVTTSGTSGTSGAGSSTSTESGSTEGDSGTIGGDSHKEDGSSTGDAGGTVGSEQPTKPGDEITPIFPDNPVTM